VADLRSTGPAHEEAAARLHAVLLRAARFEVGRRRPELRAAGAEIDDLATQAASDALMAVVSKLDDYRGESRFTTWAYKFALLEAAVKVRRRAWRDRELPLDDDAGHTQLADGRAGVHAAAESAELLRAIGIAIDSELTPHQRRILVALAIDGVPIDVLAERLSTTRGALYKTLHDARRKLRAHLRGDGLLADEPRVGEPA
jgi:RNA polymerase sigma-70 factor (ECF subfamily)